MNLKDLEFFQSLSVVDFYPANVAIPPTHIFVNFRPLKSGEKYLSNDGSNEVLTAVAPSTLPFIVVTENSQEALNLA